MQNISSRMNNVSTVSKFLIFCFSGPWIFQFLQAGFFIVIYLAALMGNDLIFTVASFSSVQLLGHVWLSATPWTAAHQVSLSITNSWSLLKLQGAWMVGDAIQPSHPLLSPSPPVFNLSQNQDLFKWVSSSHHVAKVLEFQHQSFQWIFRTDFL